jgi:hypothetical protein
MSCFASVSLYFVSLLPSFMTKWDCCNRQGPGPMALLSVKLSKEFCTGLRSRRLQYDNNVHLRHVYLTCSTIKNKRRHHKQTTLICPIRLSCSKLSSTIHCQNNKICRSDDVHLGCNPMDNKQV